MSDKKFYKGKPVEGEALDELLKSWPIPDVSEDPRKLSGRSTAFGQPLEQVYQKQSHMPQAEPETQEPEDFPTLTLEELEQIRQDAYEEGIKQGHEQGYIEGFDKGVTDGKEAGYKEGVELGKTQGQEEVKPLMDEQLTHLRSLLDSLSDPLKKVDEQAEKQLVQLATMLSEAIIYQEIKTSPDIILHTLKKSIDALNAEQQKVKIHLHPEDLTLIKTSYGEQAIEDNHWQLIAEPTLDRGGCEIKTPQSSLDMTIKTRVKETLENFLHSSGI